MTDQTQEPVAAQPEIDAEAAAQAEAERRKTLPPAALRALEEAEARHAATGADALPTELGGRLKGLEPVRYGDWEKKGLAIDF